MESFYLPKSVEARAAELQVGLWATENEDLLFARETFRTLGIGTIDCSSSNKSISHSAVFVALPLLESRGMGSIAEQLSMVIPEDTPILFCAQEEDLPALLDYADTPRHAFIARNASPWELAFRLGALARATASLSSAGKKGWVKIDF